jgi:nitroreductase
VSTSLEDTAFDVLFRDARSQNKWLDKPVSEETLKELYDLMKWAPTSANCFPIRIVFAHSQAEKDRLSTMVMDGNIEKVRTAGAVAIMGYDTKFFDHLPELFPHDETARSWFADAPDVAEATAFRNSTLQGAYLMMAARSLGLDCGPLSGFDPAAVEAAYFPGGQITANFLCGLGYGDPEGLFGRSPRPDFDKFCSIL